MSDNDLHRFFTAILPSSLTQSKMSHLKSSGRELELPRGVNTEFASETHRWVIFVADGAAKLVGHAGSDREQIVAFALKGDILLLPDGRTVQYYLSGLTDTKILAFPIDDLVRTIASDSDAIMVIFDRALAALDYCNEMSVLLGRKTAFERVASFLESMGQRIGNEQAGVTSIDLPMSRREIADSLGLTLETVSRQFTELREQGVIDTKGRSEVSILSPHRLRDLAKLKSGKAESFRKLTQINARSESSE
ncbi:helix-turn-helix domain-containing protein [Qipengyuania sp. XHP0207]|uniref:helix-turn-helix domain-containing protein n=1 Tax=Qipengyuania sp. XHP0207 TaxID=3038078 RepID=UPI00241EAF7B|nr:helix-turn-helix domain-containing protein [Qipengyuania sp. XHP0207]MDG5747573.1 helix-turn-helix domain-containing protein [Qipengyuania sp. XHP0207]